MFVVTLSKTSLKKLGLGAMCCALVVGSALLGPVHQQPHRCGLGGGEQN